MKKIISTIYLAVLPFHGVFSEVHIESPEPQAVTFDQLNPGVNPNGNAPRKFGETTLAFGLLVTASNATYEVVDTGDCKKVKTKKPAVFKGKTTIQYVGSSSMEYTDYQVNDSGMIIPVRGVIGSNSVSDLKNHEGDHRYVFEWAYKKADALYRNKISEFQTSKQKDEQTAIAEWIEYEAQARSACLLGNLVDIRQSYQDKHGNLQCVIGSTEWRDTLPNGFF